MRRLRVALSGQMFIWWDQFSFLRKQSWQLHSDDEDNVSEVSEAAEYIVSLFRIPLEARGMSAELIGDEIENVVCYARKYRKIWYKIFTGPDSAKWYNIIILTELIFSLPISTCCVEQLFSKLKVIKTKRHSSLSNSTLHNLLKVLLSQAIKCWFSNWFFQVTGWKKCWLKFVTSWRKNINFGKAVATFYDFWKDTE